MTLTAAARGAVIVSERGCDYFVARTFKGNSVLELIDGERPAEGDEIVGDFEGLSVKGIRDETAKTYLTVRVEGYRLGRREAIDLYYELCGE